MPLYLRHSPERDVHRFPGCLIVLAKTIRPFTQSLSRKTRESYTLGPISGQTWKSIRSESLRCPMAEGTGGFSPPRAQERRFQSMKSSPLGPLPHARLLVRSTSTETAVGPENITAPPAGAKHTPTRASILRQSRPKSA